MIAITGFMYAREQSQFATPVGTVTLTAVGPVLVSLTIGGADAISRETSAVLVAATEQVEQWFAGERTTFDLPLQPLATVRGEALRQGMIDIGYGMTMSYGALARHIGSSPRAIGQACARNPLPIIVPCHRVLASGGVLGNYSGGEGPVTKAWLLAHEARHHPDPARLL